MCSITIANKSIKPLKENRILKKIQSTIRTEHKLFHDNFKLDKTLRDFHLTLFICRD